MGQHQPPVHHLPDYRRFRESAVFTTKRGKGVRLHITVQTVAGGDAQTVPVDPDAYPR